MNASRNRLTRKPYAGNPHVRFEEGEGSLLDPLYSTKKFSCPSVFVSFVIRLRFAMARQVFCAYCYIQFLSDVLN